MNFIPWSPQTLEEAVCSWKLLCSSLLLLLSSEHESTCRFWDPTQGSCQSCSWTRQCLHPFLSCTICTISFINSLLKKGMVIYCILALKQQNLWERNEFKKKKEKAVTTGVSFYVIYINPKYYYQNSSAFLQVLLPSSCVSVVLPFTHPSCLLFRKLVVWTLLVK